MPQGDKTAHTDKQKRKADAAARPETRAWAAAGKLHGAGKKINSRSKVPFGPVGGSGRKTNRARSS